MPAFTGYGFKSTGGVGLRNEPDRWADKIQTKEMGAIADGSSHPLSSVYGSLGAAQVVYPFATALTQEIDYCAVKAASNLAFGADGAEHNVDTRLNRRVVLNAGSYQFGNDTWKVKNLRSGLIEGDGKLVTSIYGNKTIFQSNGLWYTKFSNLNMQLQAADAVVCFDMDGNIAHDGSSIGVQGNILENTLIVAGGSTFGLALCRVGDSYGQGDSQLFLNTHWQSASFANYIQYGYNVLDNTFIGGDMQAYPANGIYSVSGTLSVSAMSFESTYGYTQYLNDGYDINIGHGGAFEGCSIYGCRSESMRFLYNAGEVIADVRACRGNISFNGWQAGHAFAYGEAVYETSVPSTTGNGRIFAVTVSGGGTSGGTEPAWPTDGTPIVDGGVTWQEVIFNFILNGNGYVDLATCYGKAGSIKFPRYGQAPAGGTSYIADFTISQSEDIVAVDATAGPITVTIPPQDSLDRTRVITIVKTDTSANAVTITPAAFFYNTTEFTNDTIAGGARGSCTYMYMDVQRGYPATWFKIASRSGNL